MLDEMKQRLAVLKQSAERNGQQIARMRQALTEAQAQQVAHAGAIEEVERFVKLFEGQIAVEADEPRLPMPPRNGRFAAEPPQA